MGDCPHHSTQNKDFKNLYSDVDNVGCGLQLLWLPS